MKKIYLLSAVACMFAYNSYAGGEWTFETEKSKDELVPNEWFCSGANAMQPVLTPMQVSGATEATCGKFKVAEVMVADTGDQWATQFCYVFKKGESAGFEPGVLFQLEFDVMFDGPEADEVGFNVLTGKLLDDRADSRTHEDWQWNGDNNKELDYGGNFWGIHNKGYKIKKGEWSHIVWPDQPTKIGDAGWLGLQINLANRPKEGEGSNVGSFYFAHFTFDLGGKKTVFFNEKDYTSINETAVMKAYFANDVLYASEAADVVIYNINGVAVKSVKNAVSVNVADLKAGLYIAKVGNATVKFVK